MYRKVVLALMLVMHYSLAFGAIESAAMPDEHHPFGKTVPHTHLHQHSHDGEHVIDVGHSHAQENDHRHAPEPEHINPVHQDSPDDFHDYHHKHGINIQLNVDIPVLVALDFYKPDTPSITPYQLDHNSLSYAPAVPPPDSL